MTKFNLKKVKDCKRLLSKDTNFHQHKKMLSISTVIREMRNKDTPLLTLGGGRMWGAGNEPPAAPPPSVDHSSSAPAPGVRHTPNLSEKVPAVLTSTAKSRQELSTTYQRTNKTQWAVSRNCLVCQSREGWWADSRDTASQIFLLIQRYITVMDPGYVREHQWRNLRENTSLPPPPKISFFTLHTSCSQYEEVWVKLGKEPQSKNIQFYKSTLKLHAKSCMTSFLLKPLKCILTRTHTCIYNLP